MFAVLALSLAAQTDRPPTETAARIAPLVSRYSQLGYLNGAVLVARHGTVLYSNGIGYANFASRTPNTPQTKFGIASLTKQFTAVLILQQIADGKIKLDGKLSDYLPWYRKDTASRITIEQLLHHTAGLPPHGASRLRAKILSAGSRRPAWHAMELQQLRLRFAWPGARTGDG